MCSLRLIGALSLFAASLGLANAEFSAQLIPRTVEPGDMFELRVERESADFATFSLHVPRNEHLHLVATESVPVAYENGLYWQRESWFLQADASGDYSIENATVQMSSGGEEIEKALPTLSLAVMAYSSADSTNDPMAYPLTVTEEPSLAKLLVGLSLLLLVGIALYFLWRRRLSNREETSEETVALSRLETVLLSLKAGRLEAGLLEELLHSEGNEWSVELRAETENILYAKGGDERQLRVCLEREMSR